MEPAAGNPRAAGPEPGRAIGSIVTFIGCAAALESSSLLAAQSESRPQGQQATKLIRPSGLFRPCNEIDSLQEILCNGIRLGIHTIFGAGLVFAGSNQDAAKTGLDRFFLKQIEAWLFKRTDRHHVMAGLAEHPVGDFIQGDCRLCRAFCPSSDLGKHHACG